MFAKGFELQPEGNLMFGNSRVGVKSAVALSPRCGPRLDIPVRKTPMLG